MTLAGIIDKKENEDIECLSVWKLGSPSNSGDLSRAQAILLSSPLRMEHRVPTPLTSPLRQQIPYAIEKWGNLNKFAINTTTPLSIPVNASNESGF